MSLDKSQGEKLEFKFNLFQKGFYRKAQEFEEKSYKHDLEMSDIVEIESQKNLLLKLPKKKKVYVFTGKSGRIFVQT